ncbi:unnamed protein product [Acanthoscelides obtectus]|uniref:SAP domain-containing protein n=1 Tax=Acanthoscelides obtectus TaxID=200917 RepID=A0A9P0P465_ACAOB|nr:unnamed protein product [Acanthoscelides obtectus]CAK1632345.1 hypothetical protein AOBTE_LOCUS7493 [Acanthoscelides obtectus]
MARLVDLKNSDLKSELEERECDTAGKKAELQERLRLALIEECKDPDIFIFTGAGDIGLMLQNLSTKLEHKLKENCADLLENSTKLEKRFVKNYADLFENSAELEKKAREELYQHRRKALGKLCRSFRKLS